MLHSDFIPSHHLQNLELSRQSRRWGHSALKGMRVAVVGAGPAGLTFARSATSQGADVTVFERAEDPRVSGIGYTDRSFNITLDEVGRNVLADTHAWIGGSWLVGRALHDGAGVAPVRYGSYGPSQHTHLIGIPRFKLRQNLTDLADDEGAHLKFGSKVVSVDPHAGNVSYQDREGGMHTFMADLVVVSDGLHSLGDGLGGENSPCVTRLEERNYIMALLNPEAAAGLSADHIHFWHEPVGDAYTVGIPNSDGSMALLLTSEFPGLTDAEHPFESVEAAEERLRRDFPSLYRVGPGLIHQLPLRRRGRFTYKKATSFVLGGRAAVVGDAGCVVPPWAGFGANSAMYAADSLVFQLLEHQSFEAALQAYGERQQLIANSLMGFVDDQGEFLSGPVAQDPDARSNSLVPIIRQALQQATIVA